MNILNKKIPIVGQAQVIPEEDCAAEVERLAKFIGIDIPKGTPQIFWALPLLIGLTVRLQKVCVVIDGLTDEIKRLKAVNDQEKNPALQDGPSSACPPCPSAPTGKV